MDFESRLQQLLEAPHLAMNGPGSVRVFLKKMALFFDRELPQLHNGQGYLSTPALAQTTAAALARGFALLSNLISDSDGGALKAHGEEPPRLRTMLSRWGEVTRKQLLSSRCIPKVEDPQWDPYYEALIAGILRSMRIIQTTLAMPDHSSFSNQDILELLTLIALVISLQFPMQEIFTHVLHHFVNLENLRKTAEGHSGHAYLPPIIEYFKMAYDATGQDYWADSSLSYLQEAVQAYVPLQQAQARAEWALMAAAEREHFGYESSAVDRAEARADNRLTAMAWAQARDRAHGRPGPSPEEEEAMEKAWKRARTKSMARAAARAGQQASFYEGGDDHGIPQINLARFPLLQRGEHLLHFSPSVDEGGSNQLHLLPPSTTQESYRDRPQFWERLMSPPPPQPMPRVFKGKAKRK